MTSTEDNQTRRQQDQAVVNALMSDDAARAIEILYRTVVHGIPVPDPDVVATLAVQPPPPHPDRPRTGTHHRGLRRHTWIRTAVPLALGLAAVIGSLGWSYADYNDRQQEWQRIAEEQTNLAIQREKTAQAWERTAREQDAFVRKVEAFETAKRERRARQVQRIQDAIALEEWNRAFVDLATLGDFIACDQPNQESVDQFCHLVDDLIARAKEQGPPGFPPVSPVPKEQ